MSWIFYLVLGLVTPQIHSYDPARLTSGSVKPIPYQTRASGLVLHRQGREPRRIRLEGTWERHIRDHLG